MKNNEKEKQKKPFYKRPWFIILVIFVVIAVIGSSGDNEEEKVSNKSEIEKTTTDETKEDLEKEVEEEGISGDEEEIEKEDEVTKYGTGTYKIGEDLPAGEYKLFSEGTISYFQVSKDSSGSLESIVCNDNFKNFTYITVNDGQYLELKGCYAIPVDEAPKYEAKDGKYEEGTYKVGVDIPAGEYKVVSNGGNSYVEVSKDSLGTFESIITNDNFSNDKYITVSDGQYLKIVNAYIQTE